MRHLVAFVAGAIVGAAGTLALGLFLTRASTAETHLDHEAEAVLDLMPRLRAEGLL